MFLTTESVQLEIPETCCQGSTSHCSYGVASDLGLCSALELRSVSQEYCVIGTNKTPQRTSAAGKPLGDTALCAAGNNFPVLELTGGM